MSTHRPKPSKLYYPDVPYENHKQTKEIIRMELQRIVLGIEQGSSLSEMHHLLMETQKLIDKMGDEGLSKAFKTLMNTIQGNWPLDGKTPWDIIEKVGRILAYLDQKTVF